MSQSKAIKAELQRRLQQANKPQFNLADYAFKEQRAFILDSSRFKTAVCSRRCLAEGTLVQTTLGPKTIEQITTDDFVYSEHGLPIKVKQVFYNGVQSVVDVVHSRRTMFRATKNHRMLTTHARGSVRERALEELYGGVKIVRKEVSREHGIAAPYAYAVGALLGDGCSRVKHTSYVTISSEDSVIPDAVAKALGATRVKKNSDGNFSYSIYVDRMPEEYTMWCNQRYAHEKVADVARLLSWDRPSRLAFIAGLIDTDGSVSNCKDGLQIDISMQAKSVIDAARTLFIDLWGYAATIHTDSRDKYKNGPVYCLRLKNNYFGKKILKDLDPYLQTARKKWRPEYEQKLENNYRPDCVGVTLGESSLAHTYDIHVQSDTNLYLLANGLVTHNSGKTVGSAADMIATCIAEPDAICLYIALTTKNARSIIWNDLKKIIRDYDLKVKTDDTKLTIKFANASEIRLGGAKDEVEIEKYRGWKLRKVYIDEAQSFRPYLKYFINDILLPALRDLRGQLIITGTPGPIPAGPFYEYATSPNLSHHHWTAFENPHMHDPPHKDLNQTLAEERMMKGISESDPGYQRETYGKWIEDLNSLVFKFSPRLNVEPNIPTQDMIYIFGIDIGYEDADAIAVLGYNFKDQNVYLVEELITTKQTISALVAQIKDLQGRYKPVKMVMDAGALGKKIQEEIKQRHSLPIEAADKHRKMEFIELLNDDLRTGKLKAFPGSRFEQDCALVQWDRSDPYKLAVSDTYHSDVNDACLYAWRECKHYIPKDDEASKPKTHTQAFMDQLEEKEAAAMEASLAGDDGMGVDQMDLDSIFDAYDDDF